MNGKPIAALAGLACAGVAVAAAQLAAAAVAPGSAPLAAVGAVMVDATPEPVKAFAIRTFGFYDKLVLFIGIGLALAAAAALVGVLARRRIAVGYTALALLGATGAAAALSRPAAAAAWVLPSLVGAAAGALVLGLLYRRPQSIGASGRVVDRRGVLLALAGAGVMGAAGWRLGGTGEVETARGAVRLPEPVDAGPAGEGLDVEGLTSYLTPNAEFYRVDTALVLPQVLPDDYTLRVTGRVDRPLEFSYRDLLDRDLVEREITISCVSNEVGGTLAGNARWLGVPLAELLEEAGVQPGADQVVGRSHDGWTAGTPHSACTDGRDALIAVGMNGEPLPIEHGFPVRMIVPGLYGYVSATKWLVEIELASFADFDPYWVRRDWAAEAPIKTFSRIDTPKPLKTIGTGRTAVAGVAWAQQRGIERVEVRVDEGPWADAELAPVIGPDTWRQWLWEWDAEPGRHKLEARATDSVGDTQTAERVTPFPDGATGWHSVVVTAA
ncbi:molybdopterin-dependent oxidoreductase [Glycomyces algeriensis]|uniref:Oxidoreductase n=1 Tax=Glycomyces algeriensis TaxID=256037 RepID=A0A9W6G6F1_9ACTN|nr:molybdopterin-dependent oxidoreductase [Glycomyces algeriensis]MDA1367133.1 molybdopterin-dependent oxidoreductase [Glycomyces algeriensis]MDR7348480.1 DMSO/TMAO reductase YedYZ molybdopterin-dependent catalytic subunit [Glycomyces algeriensis]GLI41184.1 oxidoreductase [Glycomyces algeriensis]